METHITLALGIMRAMKAREDSYDHASAEAAYTVAQKEKEAQPNNLYAGFVDFSKFYKLSLFAACSIAGPLQHPVYLLLELAGNDAQKWATQVLIENDINYLVVGA